MARSLDALADQIRRDAAQQFVAMLAPQIAFRDVSDPRTRGEKITLRAQLAVHDLWRAELAARENIALASREARAEERARAIAAAPYGFEPQTDFYE